MDKKPHIPVVSADPDQPAAEYKSIPEGDYIPTDDAEFDAWSTNFLTYTAEHAQELGVSPEQVAQMAALHASWRESWEAEKRALALAAAAKAYADEALLRYTDALPPPPSGLPS